MKMETILIVDDDKTIRVTLKTLLEENRYHVFDASLCERSKDILKDHFEFFYFYWNLEIII